MTGVALALSCALLGASSGETSMTGAQAPDLYVGTWAVTPATSLRALRGRKAIVVLFHTAC
jgi:hypothetical protein